MRLGKVVKSNSHCDYVVQLYDKNDVVTPPSPEKWGFGSFVKLEDETRHWAIGIIYNSVLDNPLFANSGPRLSSAPDPLFAPDLIGETRTLLGVVLIGSLSAQALPGAPSYGMQGIPRVVVPINSQVSVMTPDEIYRFHLNPTGQPQFSYYSHLLRFGGAFASQLTQQVLNELADSQLFTGAEQRALEMLCKELSWKNTLGVMR
ncbi:MAG TPA: hypothetical protein V6C88_20710 [Chroococcidiopsis sp.]